MLFNSAEFLLFLPVVVLIYYLLPNKAKSLWLLVCSYYFYMSWNARFALLILFSTVVTYFCGLWLDRVKHGPEGRSTRRTMKWIIGLSLFLNLMILFYFKYFSFFISNLDSILRLFGASLGRTRFDIVLPVGISFYTFQALGYTIDVYRGDVRAERSFLQYALFVSFFPQLVAGPIERSGNLMRQLATPHKPDFQNIWDGLLLMLWGFFLKIVVADRIALFVDSVFGEDYLLFGGWYVIVATMLFAVQIYCDFGGYSTIAMGAAKMLGVELMENFNTPYLSMTTAEFWRRWHISLSSWFRDYLYIPLGGSRKGKLRKYLNIFITFSVSGLWHGARWNFVVWGALNGFYQILGEMLRPCRDRVAGLLGVKRESLLHRGLKTLTTFLLIDFAWLFFRAPQMKAALLMIKSLFTVRNPEILFNGALYECGLNRQGFLLMLLSIAFLAAADLAKYRGVRLRELIMRQNAFIQALIVSVSIGLILLFGIWGSAYDAASFIYFQF